MNSIRVSRPVARLAATTLVAVTLLVTGCVVFDKVTVYPVVLRLHDESRRLTSVAELADNQEYGRALQLAWTVDERSKASLRELAALGHVEMVGGRFDDAKRHLRAALAKEPSRDIAAAIYWDLSQVAYLQDDFGQSLELAQEAVKNGLRVKEWHLQLLEMLSSRDANIDVAPTDSGYVPMQFGAPDIPRVEVTVNASAPVDAIVDSGAVLTIVSESFANRAGIRRLGTVGGTLIGLLGESITVRYGVVDSMAIGPLVVKNVPVAIMPDDKLSFFSVQRKPFRMSMLLGTNFLKHFRIELDVARKRARFTPVNVTGDKPRPDQNLFYVGLRPMIEAAIDRHGWYLFLLDTGSEITFLNHTMLNRTSLGRWSKLHGATLQGLGGSTKHGSRLQNVEISMGGWAGRFSTIALYATDPPSFGIIGQNFLSKFRVVIDFGKMRIDFIEGAS